ncbi:MAG: heme o synthase [bacterium]
MKDYLELAKARLSALVVLTTAAGFVLGRKGDFDFSRFVWTLVGTSMLAGGANAFNQWMETSRDARMVRTAERPLPSGRMSSAKAVMFASILTCMGLSLLATVAGALTTLLAVVATLIYLLIYTPLKPLTPFNTLFGAVTGAIPPMMGWAAASGRLGFGAWLLAALLFSWQIPHFMALAWLYREDYERGGFRMLPAMDESGRLTCQVIVLFSISMISVGIMFPVAGIAGWAYTVGSLLLGLGMFLFCAKMYYERSRACARRLFVASVIYLPLLLGLMIADHAWRGSSILSSIQMMTEQSEEFAVPIIPVSSQPASAPMASTG